MSWGNNGFALQISGSGRRTGDYDTPEGQVPNSYLRSGFVNVGASRTGANGYLGASYGYDRTHYGIPLVEEGQTNLDPRRNVVNVRGERTNLNGFVNAVRGSFGYRRYRHDELDGDEVVTQFKNDIADFQFMAGHRAAGRMTGSFGLSGLTRPSARKEKRRYRRPWTNAACRRSYTRNSRGRTSRSSSAREGITAVTTQA
jgi:iron complex outermembrane recepter protein